MIKSKSLKSPEAFIEILDKSKKLGQRLWVFNDKIEKSKRVHGIIDLIEKAKRQQEKVFNSSWIQFNKAKRFID